MALEVIELSDKHRHLLKRLAELIPDLDPDAPESLQRIFGLGLIALTLQITNKAKTQQQDDLVAELGDLAREMIEAENSPDSPG
jgi:ubiquinone biosynthesis protein UbiJ